MWLSGQKECWNVTVVVQCPKYICRCPVSLHPSTRAMVNHWSALNEQKYKLVRSCQMSPMPASDIAKGDMLRRMNVLIRIFTCLAVSCAYPPLHAIMSYEINCGICGNFIINTTPRAVFSEIEKWNKLYRRQKKKAQRSGVVVPAEDVEVTTSRECFRKAGETNNAGG